MPKKNQKIEQNIYYSLDSNLHCLYVNQTKCASSHNDSQQWKTKTWYEMHDAKRAVNSKSLQMITVWQQLKAI